jgi:hypothetical protein
MAGTSYRDDLVTPRVRRSSGAASRTPDAAVVKAARILLVVIGALVMASLASRVLSARMEDADPESALTTMMLAVEKMLDVNKEGNVPTWFSSGMLLGCALLVAGIAALVRQAGGPFVMHWIGLALVLAFLSLDEATVLHERLTTPVAGVLGENARGPLRFAWIIPAGIVVGLIGLAYLRFLAHLPARARSLLRAGVILYLTGAVGMEIAGGMALDELGSWTLYALVTTAEETLEMLGTLTILCALLTLVRVDGASSGYRLLLHPAVSRAATDPRAARF